MKDGTCDLLKFPRLCRALWGDTGCDSKLKTAGLLERLWELTRNEAPQGDLGARATDQEVAEAVWWTADAPKLMEALVDAHWLDRDAVYRLIVHDWPEHCPRYVKKRLREHGLTFVEATPVPSDDGVDTPGPPSAHPVRTEGAQPPTEGRHPTDTDTDTLTFTPTDTDIDGGSEDSKTSDLSGSPIETGDDDLINPSVCAQRFMLEGGLPPTEDEARCWRSAFEAIATTPHPNAFKERAYVMARQVRVTQGIKKPSAFLVHWMKTELAKIGVTWGEGSATAAPSKQEQPR